MKKVIIIGVGPAGITAALELLRRGKNEYDVTVLEESDSIGGISRTVNLDGNRMDIGGHRFFSKEQRVNEWWQSILPLQGAPSKDDKLLKREAHLVKGGADPEKTDKVMLYRLSHDIPLRYLRSKSRSCRFCRKVYYPQPKVTSSWNGPYCYNGADRFCRRSKGDRNE